MLFSFHEVNGVSIAAISEFLDSSIISLFVASKPTHLKKLARIMQKELANFGEDQKKLLSKNMPVRSITVAQDETFFGKKPCLVGMALPSNFILLEKMADDRRTETWNKSMDEAVKGLSIKIIQSTSDQGSSLLKHTKESLCAAHSPDTFHVVQDIGRSGSASLNANERQCRKKLDLAMEKTQGLRIKVDSYKACSFKKETVENRLVLLEKDELVASEKLRDASNKLQKFNKGRLGIGQNYHPYDLLNGLRQTPEKVASLLTKNMLECKSVISHLGEKSHLKLAKAMRLIPAMKDTLIFYFNMASISLDQLKLDTRKRGLIEDELMPAAYLKSVAQKTRNKKQAARLDALANEKLLDFNRRCGPYAFYSQEELREMREIAAETIQIFQRSSSCVEGRNAQLNLKHHNLHRLTDSKLSALTVIHNFHTTRCDGTTPAQRFFKQAHPPLFGNESEVVAYLKARA